jgi:AbrB family looped-hinge helix DNA binding protein
VIKEMTVATTRLSSKGQIVIPEPVRDELGLKPGTQFVVTGERDVVILKVVSAPAVSDFSKLVARVRRQARRARVKKADVARIVRKVRSAR